MPAIEITGTGNLARDPDLRFTPSGAPVATFTVASTETARDRVPPPEDPWENSAPAAAGARRLL